MKPRVLLAAIFLAVLTAIPTMASAAFVHYFDCNLCHRDGAAWNSVDAQGVCISCHNTGDVGTSFDFGAPNPIDGLDRIRPDDNATSGTINSGFSTGDASDALGSNPSPGTQSSHNWGASDSNPAAGASPASSAMYDTRNGASRGFVSCYKCHDPHTFYDADYIAGNEMMLRTETIGGESSSANSEANVEAMCIECHLDWASVIVTEDALLSHPMYAGDYNTDYGNIADNGFKPFAGAGSMKLLAGNKIGCSSCHGLHATDSGATFDGKLLKAGGALAPDGGESICTSCHEHMAHPLATASPATAQISCLVCHSGHSYNDGTPNYYVLRSDVQVPADSDLLTAGQTISGIRYTDLGLTTNELYRGPNGNDGVCTGCHGAVSTMVSPQTHTEDMDCAVCHIHYDPANPDNSFAGKGCNGCHGYPPNQNIAGGDPNTGYASDPVPGTTHDYATNNGGATFKDESVTPHVTHAETNPIAAKIDCKVCHNAHVTDFNLQHNNGTTGPTFENVLEGTYALSAIVDAGGILTTTTYDPAGNLNAGTCSAVYCHSNGGTYRAGGKIEADYVTDDTIFWADGANTGAISDCSSCHDDNNTDIGDTGPKNNSPAHAVHVIRYDEVGSSCNLCHVQTTDGSVIDSPANHVDGTVQFATDSTFVIDTVAVATLGGTAGGAASCAVYCHSDGNGVFANPAWDDGIAAGACGACHSDDPATIDAIQGGGAHFLHLSDPNGPGAIIGGDCSVCHTHDGSFAPNNGHIDKSKLVKTDACDSCHGRPLPLPADWTVAGTVDEAPVWTDPTTVRCDTCHSGVPSVINTVTAPEVDETAYGFGHGKTTSSSCTSCHEAATVAGHLGIPTIDRLDTVNHPIYDPSDDRAFCNDCHTATTLNHNALDGTVCKACHDQHGDITNTFDAMLNSDVGGNTVVGFADKAVVTSYVNTAGTGVCQTCHTATNHYLQNIDPSADLHPTNPGSGLITDVQLCIDCHDHGNDPGFTYGAGTSCDGCHGFPPVNAAHTLHAPEAYVLDQAGDVTLPVDLSACAACHTGADSYTYDPGTDQGNSLNHSNAAGRVTILTAAVGFSSVNEDCTSACHTSTVANGGAWNGGTQLDCDACHGNPPTTGGGDNSAHGDHITAGLTCISCHDSDPVNTTHIDTYTGADEATRVQSMTVALPANVTVDEASWVANADRTCSTSVCHNPSFGATNSANWDTSVSSCTLCHSDTDPGTASHNEHLNAQAQFKITIACIDCHGDTTTGGTDMAHRSGTVDLAGGIIYTGDQGLLTPASWGTCSTTICHNDGLGVAAVTPVWGTASADCTICHTEPPTGGSHPSHPSTIASCTQCHDAVVPGTTAPTDHLDNNVDVYDAAQGDLNYPITAALGSASWTSCDTLTCHNDGQGTANGTTAPSAVVTPAWGVNGATCGQCHAASPVSAKHDEHLLSYGATCGDCHAGVTDGSTLPTANHLNGTIDVITNMGGNALFNYSMGSVGMPPADGWGTCADPTTGCHGTPEARPWDAAATGCNSCHGQSDTTGAPIIGSDMISTNLLGQHDTHVNANSYSCNTCHNGHGMPTIDDKITISFTGLAAGGGYDPPGQWTVGKWLYDQATVSATQDCSNIYCHSSGQADGGLGAPTYATPDWGDAASGACGTCHSDTDPATGAHTTHVNDGTIMVDKSCADCHTGGAHVDQNIDVNIIPAWGASAAYSGDPAPQNAYGDCTNTYCHSDGKATPTYRTIAWGANIADCTSCHDEAKLATTLSGAHEAHVWNATTTIGKTLGCVDCHAATVSDNTTISTPANHVNTAVDVISCATNDCHSDGNFGNLVHQNPDFAIDTFGCVDCHGDAATQSYPSYADGNSGTADSNSHNAHVGGSSITCVECHADTSTVGTSIDGVTPAQHVDGIIDVVFEQGGSYVDGTDTCSTTYCHGSGTPQWGGATQDCASCHSASNALANSHGSHYEIAADAIVNNSNNDSVAGSYVFQCGNCHNSATTTHAGGVVGVDQAAEVDLSGTGSYTAGVFSATDRGFRFTAGTCDTNDCHQDGTGGAPNTAAPQWTTTLAADCTGCHDNNAAAASTMGTSSHPAHMDDGTIMDDKSCNTCHNVTVDGSDRVIADKTQHVDGGVDVDLAATYGGSFATGDCTTVYCHSNGQAGGGRVDNVPTWGTPISDCVSCHEGAAAGTGLSGAHEAHVWNATTTIGTTLGCVDCHAATVSDNTTISTPANHVNTAVDVISCATNDCHSDGNFGNLVHQNPDFAIDTFGCVDCHGDAATQSYPSYADGNNGNVNANSHNAHVGSSTIDCEQCHNTTSTVGTSIDGIDETQHVDGGIDVTFAQGGTFDAGETCSATYCHGSGASPAWGDTTPLACNTCHSANNVLFDSHSAHYESATVAVSGDFTAANNSSQTEYIFNCGNCHSGTSHAGGAVSVVQAAEVNLDGTGNYTAAGSAAAASPDRGFAFTDGSCDTNDCHNDGTGGAPNTAAPQWTGAIGANCTGCHDNNVASTNPMATVAHTSHLTTTYGSSKTCNTCHAVTVDGTDRAIADKRQHVDGGVDVDILAAVDGGNSAYAGGCDAVYCHSPGQNSTGGALGGTDYAIATWATPASGACGTCHDVTEVAGLTSGSHAAHLGATGVNGCADCHTGALNNASAYDSTNHVNQLIDVEATNNYNDAGAPGNGYNTCSTASCHDTGRNSGLTDVWGTTLNNCSECHPTVPATFAHTKHLSSTITATITCSDCHNDTIQGTTASTAGDHRDGNIDVYDTAAGDLGYPAVKGLGTGTVTCGTSYCHGDNMPKGTVSGTTNAPNWNGTSTGCVYCHDVTQAPVAISAHDGKTFTDCITCHDNANAAGNGFVDPTLHINGTLEGGGDSCTDCHNAADIDGGLNGVHNSHVDMVTFLGVKTVSGGDYGTNGWWSTTYTAGVANFGCGMCHPAAEGTSHPINGLNVDLDPGQTGASGVKLLYAAEDLTGINSRVSATCSTVYCHSDAAGTFQDTLASIGDWYNGTGQMSGNCDECHGNSPTTNAHGIHEVGIHYEDVYSGGSGLMPATGTVSSGAAHGDSVVSSTITCYTCHSGTVTDTANAGNTTCSSCHSDTNTIVTGNELARILSGSSTHINGTKDVVFADMTTFKSRAQLRDDLADADDGVNLLSAIWNRITGYKGATDRDEPQAAFNTPTFGGGTCSTVVCHNGNEATWTDSGVDCMYCHTSLPK